MPTWKRIDDKISGCRTPDPPVLKESSRAQKRANAEDESREAGSGSQTPCRIAEVNLASLTKKLQELKAEEEKHLETLNARLPFGLTSQTENGLDGNVMKVVMNTNLSQPWDTTSSSVLPAPPPPHPELRLSSQNRNADASSKPSMSLMKVQVVSRGSVGHPFSCAGACKYVKRKGGCGQGADCPNCHYCFWSKAHTDMNPKKELFAESAAEDSRLKQAQSIANKLVSLLGGQEMFAGKPKDSKAVRKELSVGTMGHPRSCAEACKYARRRGGCMYGGACVNCHVCFWSRTSARTATDSTSRASHGAVAEDVKGQEAGSCSGADYMPVARDVQGSVARPTPPVIELNRLIADPPLIPSTNTVVSQAQEEFPGSQATMQEVLLLASVGSLGHPYSCGPACKYAMKGKCKDGRLCSHCHLCRWMRQSVKRCNKTPIEITARVSF
eukprot:TRINITY_DN24898_c0_g1_i1.p1 TRINITY_DN24898_c0_g1~~TRINITY_DN24898_c0_g1_i1.p1  ORF type:complete len:442 (+),score=71.07 TRINITY_DN24898_c0_g1_i1:47-1372(+)